MKVVKQLKKINVFEMLKNTGAIMEGHFKLTSGYHSKYYLQCAKLLEHPDLTLKLLKAGIKENNDFFSGINIKKLTLIVSPAIGAILFGYMLAYQLKKRMIFTERKENVMELRRGFEINFEDNIIIAEDVITTGGSVFEVIDICKKFNANILGVVSIVDRSNNINFGIPYISFIKLEIDKYLPQECPLCNQGIEVVYPGSRK